MARDDRFPLDADDVLQHVTQLRTVIAKGKIEPDDLLVRTFGKDKLDWIDEHDAAVRAVLDQIKESYEELFEARDAIELQLEIAVRLIEGATDEDDDEGDEEVREPEPAGAEE